MDAWHKLFFAIPLSSAIDSAQQTPTTMARSSNTLVLQTMAATMDTFFFFSSTAEDLENSLATGVDAQLFYTPD